MEFPFDPLTKFPRLSSEMSRLVTYFLDLQHLHHNTLEATFEDSGAWVIYASASFVFVFPLLRLLEVSDDRLVGIRSGGSGPG